MDPTLGRQMARWAAVFAGLVILGACARTPGTPPAGSLTGEGPGLEAGRAPSAAPTTPAGPADLVITGATLIDGTGAPPRPGTSISIRHGRVMAVASDRDYEPPEGATVLDAAGKYVIPGLTDLHVHFGLGSDGPRQPDETERVLARELFYGVTTILHLGGSDGSTESIRRLRERRSMGSLQAPFIYGTGGHLTLHGTHPVYTVFPPAVRSAADTLAAATPMSDPVDLYPLGLGLSLVRTEEAARKAVRERATGGMDAIKITVESGPTPFGNDHPQMSVQMIQAIVEEARRHDLRVFAHVTSLDELEAAFEGGAAGVVHAARNDPLPDAALAHQMAAAGFIVIPTLTLFSEPVDLDDSFLRATVSEEEVASLRQPGFAERVRARLECCAPFDDLLASIGMLHRHGVHIGVGTDSGNAFVFPGYSVHRELELLVQAGLTPTEAIEAATRRAAEILNAEDEFGTIEPGKRADLLILRANPLEDIRHTRSLEVVISEGQVVDRQALLSSNRAVAESPPPTDQIPEN
ncbi:MAG TPA: amidohydrolase family protein [Thermoanaerobaculia bacterium]|nr:amidohydrolase family protein [Thermoanaerobaculia bacterium]